MTGAMIYLECTFNFIYTTKLCEWLKAVSHDQNIPYTAIRPFKPNPIRSIAKYMCTKP